MLKDRLGNEADALLRFGDLSYNKLSTIIKLFIPIAFKKRVKSYLAEQGFYSIQEY